jgi:hypothetical protein
MLSAKCWPEFKKEIYEAKQFLENSYSPVKKYDVTQRK